MRPENFTLSAEHTLYERSKLYCGENSSALSLLAITAMLVASTAVTPMSIAILTLTIVVATIVATSLGADNASGSKNEQCSHGTTFGNSVQGLH